MFLRSIELQSSQGAIKTAFVFIVLDELDVSHEALSKPAKRLEDVISWLRKEGIAVKPMQW